MTEPDLLDKLSERTHILAPAAILVGAIALGMLRGPGAAVLAIAAGALLAAISALWTSLRVLAGDAPISLHEAIDLGAPSELQERKQAILLALSDLKREHALGKLSEGDFKEMSDRYRAQAKQLLREMDEDLAPARQKAEALLAARLEGKEEPAEDTSEDEDEDEDEQPKKKVKKAKKAEKKAGEKKAEKKAEKQEPEGDEPAENNKAEKKKSEGDEPAEDDKAEGE